MVAECGLPFAVDGTTPPVPTEVIPVERFGTVLALVQREAQDQRSDPFAIQSLALHLQDLGRHREAEGLLLQALVLLEESLGYRHPAVATVLGNLGISMQEQGELQEAEHYFRRAFSIEESIRSNSPEAAYHLEGIAMNLEKRGLHAEAEPLLRQVLAIRQGSLGDTHPFVARTLNNLALNCRDRGQKSEAEMLLNQAIAIYEKTVGAEHPGRMAALHNLTLLRKELP
jgi:tetratricopeptide (TPR) repeat protein